VFAPTPWSFHPRGELAGVDVAALCFALSALAPDTLLAEAAIAVVEEVGVAFCFGCSELGKRRQCA
jgi:Zn finger protein HypA/HybF involved in hydrogenase expression